VLVEKFDNTRVRLKRPQSAAQFDGKLDFDAYRTSVGISETKLALSILGVVFGCVALFILLIGLILANR
jgi:hypothetical protein